MAPDTTMRPASKPLKVIPVTPATPLGLHSSPAAGFDQPFEMLAACHDRVRRSLDLLARLLSHWQAHGPDANGASAARDVLRYFDLAAPQHHQDEERHVFPRLLASGDPAQVQLAQRLQAEHQRFEQWWAQARPGLLALAQQQSPHDAPGWLEAAEAFISLHAGHLAAEDDQAFAWALASTPAADWPEMGREMAGRRRG